MPKLFSPLQISKISSTASLSLFGTVSSGFQLLFARSDGYFYNTTNDLVQRRLMHDIITDNGLTFSFVGENSISPFGSILSLNIGTGMTFSSSKLVVDYITTPQIQTNNSPNSGNILGYNGYSLTWLDKITADDLASAWGIICATGYAPSTTYSMNGDVYNLGIYCQEITTTTTTAAP